MSDLGQRRLKRVEADLVKLARLVESARRQLEDSLDDDASDGLKRALRLVEQASDAASSTNRELARAQRFL